MSPESSGPAGLGEASWPGGDGWPGDAAGGGPDPGWAENDAAGGGPDADWPDDAAGGGPDTGWAGDAAGRGPDTDWPDDGPDPGWPEDDAADERDPDWPDDWPDEDQADPPWRRAAPPAAYGPGGGPRRPSLRPLALTVVAVLALGAGGGVALAIGRGLDHSSSPSATPSSQPSLGAPGGGTVPGGGGGAVGEGFITGRVEAVSSTSITIGGGPGQSMTAAITAATKVTGKVASIGGVKVGDQVSAQITMSGGQATVTAIQDPAQAPSSGGGLP
jgi:hypothetical protein